MKVAINQREIDGPWGGGNRFVRTLIGALRDAGHDVSHELEAGTDVAVMIDPRTRASNMTFGAGALLRHVAWRNPRTVVVHRVNECDERKGFPFINARLARANYAADATVFVASWLAALPMWKGVLREPWHVILNGADTAMFHPRGFVHWDGQGRLRIVTHHWGYHENKGFDVYRLLDAVLATAPWRDRIEFTYVGQLPPGFSFAHARHVRPLDGEPLADELRRHHAYLTASINEPGSNHQNEGALCGLPLVHRRSGCLPEYCEGFGEAFDGPGDVLDAVERMMAAYPAHAARIRAYPHTAGKTAAEWLALLERLVASRDEIAARRRPWRDPLLFLRNQVPL
jgi:hypothetical protein